MEAPLSSPTPAVRVRHNVVLEGLRLRGHRIVRVVEALPQAELRAERAVVTCGEAEALVELGFADRVRPGTVVRFPGRP